MPTFVETVRDHYQAGIKDETELLTRLNRIIDEIEPPLTAEKFAAFDQFHVGGLAATVELGKRAEITRDMRVLDAGSGLGGPSRFLAETIGCHITGVDLQLRQATQRAIALTTGMVVGERMREMVANFGRNLTEGRLRLVMGKCRAA